MMLANYPLHPVIAVKDLERARRWYAEKLGLHPTREMGPELLYELGGIELLVYETESAGTAQNTVAQWDVDDLDAVMADLRGRGVVFEEYDFPGLKTVNGVATLDDFHTAWFKDSDGNIFALNQRE